MGHGGKKGGGASLLDKNAGLDPCFSIVVPAAPEGGSASTAAQAGASDACEAWDPNWNFLYTNGYHLVQSGAGSFILTHYSRDEYHHILILEI